MSFYQDVVNLTKEYQDLAVKNELPAVLEEVRQSITRAARRGEDYAMVREVRPYAVANKIQDILEGEGFYVTLNEDTMIIHWPQG